MTKTSHPLREHAWTLGFMLAITLVFGSGVSALHVLTQDRVRQNESLFLRRAVRVAAGLPALPDETLLHWFETEVAAQGPGFWIRGTEPRDAPVGLVVERSEAGLWGRIHAVVGLARDDAGAYVTGVAFVEHNETPGLGARIDEPWFRDQLRGKRAGLRLTPEGTRSERPDEIDAITGATVTSVAVRDLLNRALSDETMAAWSSDERSAGDAQDTDR